MKRERGSGGGRREQNGFLWATPRARAGQWVRATSGLERDEGQEQQMRAEDDEGEDEDDELVLRDGCVYTPPLCQSKWENTF